MKISNFGRLISSILAIAVAGCASKPKVATHDGAGLGTEDRLTSMEIQYTLGHSTYRIVAIGGQTSIRTEILSDAHLIREGELSAPIYSELVRRAQGLVQMISQRRDSASLKTCRTPFTLMLARGENMQSVEGCRGGPEGPEIGRLIKDVEFLLHSETDASRQEKGPVRN